MAVVLLTGGVRCAGAGGGPAVDQAAPGAGGIGADARGGQLPPEARREGSTPPASTGTPAGQPHATPAGPVSRAPAASFPSSVAPAPLPPSRATSLAIPYLSVHAPVMGLDLDRDHRMTAPPDDNPKLVGWYQGGPAPGGAGTAVAVGHLDTDSGPAVFSGLSQLTAGRLIEVRRADGRTAVYRVDAVRTFEKAHFPDREVYGDRGRPELRLITCGGAYHRRTGYAGNVVVFAHLTAVREPGRA
ncbi:class F sortase [Streptomyces camelliae]|uniref:Class F sortase n=1 Tax=Streptomyces camelliae TaxID=3004093 RepID=A0ABY7PA96_9ACTN|nr:class F sortase [Streptomyces sp. HUAS 2-6]WBO67312.1 class F sortase [Streptomyces sp. HUAS 2-6]